MIVDVVRVEVLEGRCLRLGFDDGTEGVVDIARLVPFEGVFAPLEDPVIFAQVRVNADLGTIVWPNGADLDPAVLHQTAIASGT